MTDHIIKLSTEQSSGSITYVNSPYPPSSLTLEVEDFWRIRLKTTYNIPEYPEFCNGFTLGSHGEYFTNPTSTQNIQYPYSSYAGHFCLGIIYSRTALSKTEETKMYTLADLPSIPAVLYHFTFFAEEKWKIASDMSGSGNTANIGS